MTESQNDGNQGKQTDNTATATTTTAAGNGDDDDDDSGSNNGSMNKNGQQPQQQPSSGIWSWFGYSNASTESKLEGVSSSKADKQSIDTEEVKQEPVPVKSASWRSFFWTTSDQRDSVVIEKNGTEGEASSSPPSPKTKPPQSRPIKKNMVLPSVHPTSTEEKQLQQNDDSASSSSIVNKALRAINAMFSQYPSSSSSHSRVNPRFAKFVQSMQSHPEDIAGKKFVIIGVHGWFPTKVIGSISSRTMTGCLHCLYYSSWYAV